MKRLSLELPSPYGFKYVCVGHTALAYLDHTYIRGEPTLMHVFRLIIYVASGSMSIRKLQCSMTILMELIAGLKLEKREGP